MEGALKYDREIALDDNSSVARLLEWLRPDGRVLEIGPATGIMTRPMVERKGASVTAIEIDPQAAEQARSWCHTMIVGSIEDPRIQTALEGQQFDTIVCADVLEHLSDPWSILSFLKSHLTPDGEVLISIPNIGHAGVLAELFSGRFRYRRDGLLDETHLRFFTRNSVEELLARANLEAISWARTIREPLNTEFRAEIQDLSPGIRALLSSLPDADTYQFLVRARLKRRVADIVPNGAPLTNGDASPVSALGATPRREQTRLAQCFFDTGKGFSEEQSSLCAVQRTHVHTRISFELPAGTRAVRIDPLDSQDWFRIEEIRIQDDQGLLLWNWKDGNTPLRSVAYLENLQDIGIETGTIFIPTSVDPQIIVSLPQTSPRSGSVAAILTVAPRISLADLWQRKNQQIADLSLELEISGPEFARLREKITSLQSELTLSHNKVSSLTEELAVLTQQLHALYSSRSWKLTKGLRGIGELARWGRSELRLLKYHAKGVARGLKRRLLSGRIGRGSRTRTGSTSPHPSSSPYVSPDPTYRAWRAQHEPTLDQLGLLQDQADRFLVKPTISIILPVYKPKVKWLRDAIESVRTQTYPHWELCIADDASLHPGIRSLLEAYSKEDQRIKVVFREINGHIAESSNSALSLATGEFIALLDHDDALAPWALHRVVEELNGHPDTDYLYSDEDKLNTYGQRVDPAFKPEWSPEYLLSFMFVGHLSVYRRSLVDQVGGFVKGTEGSQDYDLCLRITERTHRIRHIPAILYHWRMHGDSVALNIDAKPYAFKAAQAALRRAFERRAVPNFAIEQSAFAGVYRPRFKPLLDADIPVLWVGTGEAPNELHSSSDSDKSPRDKNSAHALRLLSRSELDRMPDHAAVVVLDERTPCPSASQLSRLSELLQLSHIVGAQGLLVRDAEVVNAGYIIDGAHIRPRLVGSATRSPGAGARLAALSNSRGIVWSGAVVRVGALRRALASDLPSTPVSRSAVTAGSPGVPDVGPGPLRDARWSLAGIGAIQGATQGTYVTVPDVRLKVGTAMRKRLGSAQFPSDSTLHPGADPFYPQHLDRKEFDFSFNVI